MGREPLGLKGILRRAAVPMAACLGVGAFGLYIAQRNTKDFALNSRQREQAEHSVGSPWVLGGSTRMVKPRACLAC